MQYKYSNEYAITVSSSREVFAVIMDLRSGTSPNRFYRLR